MTDLTQLYAAERNLEHRLDAVREQIRDQVNYLGLNKRMIRHSDFKISPAGAVCHTPSGVVRAVEAPTFWGRRQASLAAVKHELLAMGWREE